MTHNSFDASSLADRGPFEIAPMSACHILKSGDSGRGPQQGHPVQGRAAGRCLLRRGQHLSLARPRTRTSLTPTTLRRSGTVPDAFQLDPHNRALPVDYGDVCINYDKAYFATHNLCLAHDLSTI